MSRDLAVLITTVELTWIEKQVERWLRFGRPVADTILDRRRRLLSFAPGSVFAFVRWAANDYGTAESHIDIVCTVGSRDDYQIYRPSTHLERMQLDRWSLKGTPEDLIKGHVRRLEALRRAGIVERLEADRWRIPEDFGQKALADDAARSPKATVRLLSAFDLEAQIGSDGATWLDRRMVAGVGREGDRVEAGFGGEVGDALARRQKALLDRGDASLTSEGMVRYRKNLLAALEAREVERVGQAMAAKREKLWRPLDRFETIQGTLKGPVDLASGRFAVLESGHEFSLVPWRPEIGKQRQKEMTISMDEHGGISWELGRGRGLGL